MDPGEFKAECRLLAIEFMIGQLHVMIYRLIGATPEMIDEAQEKFRAYLRTESVPGLEAVQSDLAIGEIEEAVERLLAMQREMLAAGHS